MPGMREPFRNRHPHASEGEALPADTTLSVYQDRTRQGRTRIPADEACCALSYRVRMTVDPGSPEPAYAQLAALLRTRIHAGEFDSGPLPSNRALRQEYGVGEFAVSHALRVLVDDGLIYSVPRRGYYVTRDARN